MNSKLKLSLDELHVETFDVGGEGRDGTVRAHEPPPGDDPAGGSDCVGSCYGTCGPTCQTYGCGTCYLSCLTDPCTITCTCPATCVGGCSAEGPTMDAACGI